MRPLYKRLLIPRLPNLSIKVFLLAFVFFLDYNFYDPCMCSMSELTEIPTSVRNRDHVHQNDSILLKTVTGIVEC